MDDKHRHPPAGRLSGLPRPTSRLPMPRASGAPTIRPSASKESLRGSRTHPTASTDVLTTTPRLRTTASKDRLNAQSSARKPLKTAGPPVSSQASIQDARKRSISKESSSRGPSNGSSLALRRQRSAGYLSVGASTGPRGGSPSEDESSPGLLSPSFRPAEDVDNSDTVSTHSRKPRPSLSERTIETLAQLPSSPAVRRRTSNFFEADGAKRPSSRAGSGGSRPGSSYQSDASTGPSVRPRSRPGSSSNAKDTPHGITRSSTSSYKPPLATVKGTPTKRASTIPMAPGHKTPASTGRLRPKSSFSASVGPRTPSPTKPVEISVSKYGSKTVAARPLKTRASVNGLYKKPSMSSLDKSASASDLTVRAPRRTSQASFRSSVAPGEGRKFSTASTGSTALTVDSVEEGPSLTPRKSSAALREQIAKAKAARRAASRQASDRPQPTSERSPVVPTDTTFDFGLSDDPFNQKLPDESSRKVMQSRVEMARTTGRLNISAMGLKQIPEEVLKMYDLGSFDGSWAESVDLTRFVAADNELETLDDSVFPDTDPSEAADDEDSKGQQFGGLETMDLHGNMLISLPIGLRRLQLLTSLNLAQNKLTNNCLEIISQITALRDLKLGKNLLFGEVDPAFSKLENLETLDLHGNNISALPQGLANLRRLRTLNVNENAFESLPFESLSKLPLTELLAHKNKLKGALMEVDVDGLPQLQTLDVSANQLTLLSAKDPSEELYMPSLHQLTISMNRIQSLPNVSTWKSLLSLSADENHITAIPDGFTSLQTLRHVDFSSNDIKVVPPEIARMDALAMLRITGNPLRDRKFTTMTTEELKENLANRLEPLPTEDVMDIEHFGNGFDRSGSTPIPSNTPSSRNTPVPSNPSSSRNTPVPSNSASSRNTPVASNSTSSRDTPVENDQTTEDKQPVVENTEEHEESRSSMDDDFATPPTSAPGSPSRARSGTVNGQIWPVKAGGVLDRSTTESSSLHPVICSKIAIDHTIRDVRLDHNIFTCMPNSLSFFAETLTSLSLTHNQLVGESYLTEELELNALRDLNLSNNHITSLVPLTTHLKSPNLQKIDVCRNRIVSLPVLRDAFPSMAVMLISDNHLEDLDPEAIRGLRMVNASNNDIAHLNPRIGLLGGSGGLDRLEVTGNRFRVPRWNVLERGTEATLRWLRGRVPVAEMAEWKTKEGNVEEESDDSD